MLRDCTAAAAAAATLLVEPCCYWQAPDLLLHLLLLLLLLQLHPLLLLIPCCCYPRCCHCCQPAAAAGRLLLLALLLLLSCPKQPLPPAHTRTLMSFVMERIRLRDSSDSRIIPSMPLYSSSDTYAPISAIDLTCDSSKGGWNNTQDHAPAQQMHQRRTSSRQCVVGFGMLQATGTSNSEFGPKKSVELNFNEMEQL
jgi:hypothetical protein